MLNLVVCQMHTIMVAAIAAIEGQGDGVNFGARSAIWVESAKNNPDNVVENSESIDVLEEKFGTSGPEVLQFDHGAGDFCVFELDLVGEGFFLE